jgi:L-asparaginase II
MTNPIIAEVTRGNMVESRHRGAYAVVDLKGKLLKSAGDVDASIFPRSAIKAFQCLPVIESGAADRFGFSAEEIALCCSSHNGEAEHVRVARSMLAKANSEEATYECGVHWPYNLAAQHKLVKDGEAVGQVHNNCSGKHAGMLALAKQLGASHIDYVKIDHPVQKAIAQAMGAICDVDIAKAPWGIDGCSVPTWAMPLTNMALGLARLTAPDHAAGKRIIAAAAENPFMIAGTGRFDTKLMTAIPRAFVKVGAEGVYAASIPHAGIGIALKCDDGAGRAAEVAIARALLECAVWTSEEETHLQNLAHEAQSNWRKISVGQIAAV